MSSLKFIGLRCDGCQEAFRNEEGEAVFREEARMVRVLAEPRGWACRKWVGRRVVDVCPSCVQSKKFIFESPTKGRELVAGLKKNAQHTTHG